MTAPTATESLPATAPGRWTVTLISVWVTATSFLFVSGVAFLIPSLAAARRISLAEAALLASMPSWGMVATLILWGYLTDRLGERLVRGHGWSLAAAVGAVTISQLLGAVGRVAVGRWSDLIGSRMQPVRLIAATAAIMLFALALSDQKESVSAVFLMIAVSVIAMLDNGLEATAIAEFAGPSGADAIPIFGTLIGASHYQLAWVLCGLFPLLAIPLVPTRERGGARQ